MKKNLFEMAKMSFVRYTTSRTRSWNMRAAARHRSRSISIMNTWKWTTSAAVVARAANHSVERHPQYRNWF